jgi:hypothetical protein
MTDTDYQQPQHRERQRRWATRQEAMAYAKIGSTMMNELMHSRRIFAKKLGNKVVVDLNSIDDYFDGLPDVAAENAA